jgi:ZIP family zinc transporter
MNVILAAFLLTLFAGLSTGLGSAIPFFFKSFKKVYLAFFLGLSAGVMILVSFVELLPSAVEEIGFISALISFFVGMIVVILIDFLIPHSHNPHHMEKSEENITTIQKECQDDVCEEEDEPIQEPRVASEGHDGSPSEDEKKALKRAGILTAIAIAIHNFPEGMATFAAAINDISLGISIAVAIAIHNIPEGISVSIPIYYATKKKWQSFGLSFASGLAEPVGAGVAYGILQLIRTTIPTFAPYFDWVLTASLAFVAGIMVYISIDELIPVAREYGKGDIVMAGVVVGMVIMAVSLILLK